MKDKHTKVKVSHITNINNYDDVVRIIKNRWWGITDDGCVIISGGSPICSTNESIAKMFISNPRIHEIVDIKFIEIAFLEYDTSEYTYGDKVCSIVCCTSY